MNNKMNNNKLCQWIFVFILAALLLAGCGVATPNTPAVAKPIAAGDWIATTDFGKLVFTVDTTGSKITKMSYQFSNWTCGPTTVSGTIEASAEWPITDGKFSIDGSLDSEQTMNFGGTYSAADQKFSGTWSEISHGSTCSGIWEATAPK
jgi:hypothetical protein